MSCGANDTAFEELLKKNFRFYAAIGTKRMRVHSVEAEQIHQDHDKVRVFYRATYERKDRPLLEIDFDLLYLVQRRVDGPKVFAFVAGDEMALYRRYGLVDELGQPS